MADLATTVAATALRATDAQSWTVSLNVAESLTVVALLGLGGSWHRALVGFVTRLLAVVAQPLRGSADLCVVANVATFVACSSLNGRHVDGNYL